MKSKIRKKLKLYHDWIKAKSPFHIESILFIFVLTISFLFLILLPCLRPYFVEYGTIILTFLLTIVIFLQYRQMRKQTEILRNQEERNKPNLDIYYSGSPKISYAKQDNKIYLLIKLYILNRSSKNNYVIDIKVLSSRKIIKNKTIISDILFAIPPDSYYKASHQIKLTTDQVFIPERSTLKQIMEKAKKIDIQVSDIYGNKYNLSVEVSTHTQELYLYYKYSNRLE